MIDLHVVVVNCDLIHAEKIALNVLKINLFRRLRITCWRHDDDFGTKVSEIQKLSTRRTPIVLERHCTPISSTFVDHSACYTLMAACRLQFCVKFQFDSRKPRFKIAQDF